MQPKVPASTLTNFGTVSPTLGCRRSSLLPAPFHQHSVSADPVRLPARPVSPALGFSGSGLRPVSPALGFTSTVSFQEASVSPFTVRTQEA